MRDLELLAPAGCFDTARAAFAAGADAVYLGLDAFSARAEAINFTEEDLRHLLALAHGRKVSGGAAAPKRVYVTFNTLIDEDDFHAAIEKLALLEELQPDGIIVQDLGIARLSRRYFPGLNLHASTQLVAHNLEDVLALRDLGFTRVVLARELSLSDIQTIVKRSGVEIEVFVHGALCYSLSGLCLFSALEKNRSGNRGRCAYCCRLGYTDGDGVKGLPFSMKDLRLDEDLAALREAGVASLKIEGRMKSALYVATAVRHYRELLDCGLSSVSQADLETVFSRRTTSLYLHGAHENTVIDAQSLGHLGTPIGRVKRITKDREGRLWLRFHTNRKLERHDGLQFLAPTGGKPQGMGIGAMRPAISRRNVFEVPAGADVEIEVTPELILKPGDTIYCSASNALKRRFPIPPFRPSDYEEGKPLDVCVTIAQDHLEATAQGLTVSVNVPNLARAKHPEKTEEAVRRAFSKLGETAWFLNSLVLKDDAKCFVPASFLNDLRRDLVEKLDAQSQSERRRKIEAAQSDAKESPAPALHLAPQRILKIRLGQAIPPGTWDEVVVSIGHTAEVPDDYDDTIRLALPVFTAEESFAALRARVKGLVRAGYAKWEAADLAGLRLLKQCGITDITADWTLYAFNQSALKLFQEWGVKRIVASPENNPANLAFLTSFAGKFVECLDVQSTPLFISLTRPETPNPTLLTNLKGETFTAFKREGLWITTRTEPRTFDFPTSAAYVRTDLSWDPIAP